MPIAIFLPEVRTSKLVPSQGAPGQDLAVHKEAIFPSLSTFLPRRQVRFGPRDELSGERQLKDWISSSTRCRFLVGFACPASVGNLQRRSTGQAWSGISR